MLNRTPTRPTGARPNSPADVSTADGPLAPLLVDIRGAAALLSCSARHCEDMHREGRMPAAIRLGGRALRFSVAQLREWVGMGCPDRATWEAKKAADSAKVARPNSNGCSNDTNCGDGAHTG